MEAHLSIFSETRAESFNPLPARTTPEKGCYSVSARLPLGIQRQPGGARNVQCSVMHHACDESNLAGPAQPLGFLLADWRSYSFGGACMHSRGLCNARSVLLQSLASHRRAPPQNSAAEASPRLTSVSLDSPWLRQRNGTSGSTGTSTSTKLRAPPTPAQPIIQQQGTYRGFQRPSHVALQPSRLPPTHHLRISELSGILFKDLSGPLQEPGCFGFSEIFISGLKSGLA